MVHTETHSTALLPPRVHYASTIASEDGPWWSGGGRTYTPLTRHAATNHLCVPHVQHSRDAQIDALSKQSVSEPTAAHM